MEASLPANEELLLNSRWMRRASPAEVESLLVDGADLTAWDKHGYTPLHYAAALNANPDVTALLLGHGADPNDWDNRARTPLHRAAAQNTNPDITTCLLDHGADPNARDDEGRTPLYYAVTRNANPNVVAHLLNCGADPNAGGDLLHLAVGNNNPDMVASLLAHGADPNARDKEGRTPLQVVLGKRLETAYNQWREEYEEERRDDQWRDDMEEAYGQEDRMRKEEKYNRDDYEVDYEPDWEDWETERRPWEDT